MQMIRSVTKLIENSKPACRLRMRRYYSGEPERAQFRSKVSHYLHRAKLVDSLRLALLSDNSSLFSVLGDPFLDELVVSGAIRWAPSANAALSLVNALVSIPALFNNHNTIHSLATVLANSRRTADLRLLLRRVVAGEFSNVRFGFFNLLHWHAATGDLDSALLVWEKYRLSTHCRVCTKSYNVVMRLNAQTGRNSEAVTIFYQMIEDGLIPNSQTYTVMIEHLVNSGKLTSAMDIFALLPSMRVKRTSRQYSILVDGFVGVKKFDKVRSLLKEMEADGILPGRPMRLSLERMREASIVAEIAELLGGTDPFERISGDIKREDEAAGRLKPFLAPRLLSKSLAKWTKDDVAALEGAGFVWTSRLFCKIIRHFKSPETAWEFFKWVTCQPNFTHDIYTLHGTVILLARHGKTEIVNKLMSKIRNESITLPFSTIRLIIDSFGLSKKANAALKIFRDDRDLCGPISKSNMKILYSSLLRTLTKCRRDSDAMDLLGEMISQDISPDIQIFTGLMHYFAKCGDAKTVQKLFAMAKLARVQADGHMLKVLIRAYCKCEKVVLAWRVFEELKSLKLKPDLATKELLINSLWKEGKRRETAAVEENCREISNVDMIRLCGHIWTVSSEDLIKVHSIYSNSFTSNAD